MQQPDQEVAPEARQPPRLSVIMVSYNTRALTLKALETLRVNTRGVSFETILVDNASSDGSADAIAQSHPQVRLIRSTENLGFAKANNLAAEKARGEWLLLLNPDTETYEGAIEALVSFAEAHPEGGIYGGRTVFPDGSLNIASCWNRLTPWSVFCKALGLSAILPGNPIFDTERIGSWQRDSVRHVDIVVGCFLLTRKEIWIRLGGFDLSYWMYGEDADLCLRARALGYRPMITPDATIMHLVGASSSSKADRTVLLTKSMCLLIQRHWSPPMRPIGLALVMISVWMRKTAASALAKVKPNRFGRLAAHWGHVWERRSAWR